MRHRATMKLLAGPGRYEEGYVPSVIKRVTIVRTHEWCTALC